MTVTFPKADKTKLKRLNSVVRKDFVELIYR